MRQLNVTAQGREHVNCNMIQNTARTYQFLKDQRPVRSHIYLLGGRPVLVQLSKIVYNRSRADTWYYFCFFGFLFSCLFVFIIIFIIIIIIIIIIILSRVEIS